MTTAGPNSPSAASGWTSNDGVYTLDDANFAYDSINGVGAGANLDVTGFGFSLPSTATVTGVKVNVYRERVAGPTIRDNTIKLLKAGTPTGDNKATGTTWPTLFTVATYGSSSDGWNAALSYSDVNASNFGVRIQAYNASGSLGLAYVDYVSIAVDYSTSTGQPMQARARLVPGMRRAHGAQGW